MSQCEREWKGIKIVLENKHLRFASAYCFVCISKEDAFNDTTPCVFIIEVEF